MGYYIDANGNYPRHAGDVQLIDSTFIENESTLPIGWHEVKDVEPPISTDSLIIIIENHPVLVDGQYERSWSTRPITDEELAERENNRLANEARDKEMARLKDEVIRATVASE